MGKAEQQNRHPPFEIVTAADAAVLSDEARHHIAIALTRDIRCAEL